MEPQNEQIQYKTVVFRGAFNIRGNRDGIRFHSLNLLLYIIAMPRLGAAKRQPGQVGAQSVVKMRGNSTPPWKRINSLSQANHEWNEAGRESIMILLARRRCHPGVQYFNLQMIQPASPKVPRRFFLGTRDPFATS